MPTLNYPPLTQGNGSPSPPPTLRSPSRDVHQEGDDLPSCDIHSHDPSVSSPLEVDYFVATDLDKPTKPASRFWPFLLANCRQLEQEDMKVVGAHPIGAGGFADVWVGKMGDRKVAVKSYRCYTSSGCMPTHTEASHI